MAFGQATSRLTSLAATSLFGVRIRHILLPSILRLYLKANMVIKNKKRGFTIVELLIVVVVIAILAAISIIAFQGIQQRTKDSRRYSDINVLVKALELYKTTYGQYPNPTSVNGSWEDSNEDGGSGAFMEQLTNTGVISAAAPVDPTNDASHMYRYYRYPAGTNSCDPARGAFYVIEVIDIELSSRPASTSPGFTCSGRNWNTEGDYIIGSYES